MQRGSAVGWWVGKALHDRPPASTEATSDYNSFNAQFLRVTWYSVIHLDWLSSVFDGWSSLRYSILMTLVISMSSSLDTINYNTVHTHTHTHTHTHICTFFGYTSAVYRNWTWLRLNIVQLKMCFHYSILQYIDLVWATVYSVWMYSILARISE